MRKNKEGNDCKQLKGNLITEAEVCSELQHLHEKAGT